ncbi:MAG: 2Fe-2S iron-sulfur cluster-binding protein, partial [Spirochaetota bacterium]
MSQNTIETVNIIINGKRCTVPAGNTVLEAAKASGIHIPTLCHMNRDLSPRVNCRICIVQIDGNQTLKLSCATKVSDGMTIVTNTPDIEQERKTALELILANHPVDCHHCLRTGNSKCEDLDPKFCEMCFFCDCVRDGFCELQDLAREYKIDVLPYEQRGYDHAIDASTGTIIRNPNKCVRCRRCLIVCKDVQTVGCLHKITVGSDTLFAPENNKPLAESSCVQCGRCVEVCPTGAMFMLEHKDELLYHTHKPGVTTVAQISRSVLKDLAKLFKMDTPEADIRLAAAGLRKIGIDYVVSDDFALAAVQDQAMKTLEKKLSETNGTVIVTNSPAALKFIRANFAELEGSVLVYESVQQAFGRYVTT